MTTRKNLINALGETSLDGMTLQVAPETSKDLALEIATSGLYTPEQEKAAEDFLNSLPIKEQV